MKIKQVLYKDIPRSIYKRGFSFSFPPGDKAIYFKLENDLKDVGLWQALQSVKKLPDGLIHIDALGQYNYFRAAYYPEKITEEDVLNFVKNIDLGKC